MAVTVVTEAHDTRVRVTPLLSRSRRRAQHTVIVRNAGNTRERIAIDAVDESGRLVLSLSTSEVSLDPDEEAQIALSVRSPRRALGRRPRAHGFHVVARSGVSPPATARAVYFQDPPPWRRRIVASVTVIAAVVVVLLALAGGERPSPRGVSGPDPTPAPATPTPTCAGSPSPGRVAISAFAFCPLTMTIAAGTQVTWENHDAAPHTTTFESVDSGLLRPGEFFTTRFDEPGTFSYYCRFHLNMRATIVVT